MAELIEENNSSRKAPLWLLSIVITMPTFFAFLATSATNVALPHIAGAFGSTNDEAKWVVTSYMVANGIFLPLTGWLVRKLGRLGFLKIFISIFTLGSIVCATAPSLLVLILGRVIQGIGGGILMPLSQSILLQEYPANRKGDAMAVFVFSVMVSSIMGPTVGGLLVDNISWQWIFIINIPVGILSLIIIPMIVNDTKRQTEKEAVDFLGVVFLVLWLFSMQIVLDKGQQYGWFDCTWIYRLSVFSLFSMMCFIVWEVEHKNPIVDLRVFKDLNFVIGTILGVLINGMVCATMILLPGFYQGLMHYTAADTGMALFTRVCGCFVLFIIGKICQLYDVRAIIGIGVFIMGVSIALCVDLNMQISPGVIVLSNVLFGIGSATAIVPVSAVALGSLPKNKIPDGAGIHSLSKCVTGSMATSLASSFVISFSQIHQTHLVKNMSIYSHNFMLHFSTLKNTLLHNGDMIIAAKKANLALYNQLLAQSKLCAISDLFLICATLTFLLIPLVMFLKLKKPSGAKAKVKA
ncbi:MAG: DHA2 family efflux MFS transporter permease subunit [Candidatus Gastranaerophilales bacterium]|nr:DHA2 family efflux MFS transporter permease subunit [Candidatus Gastranaerophilales bacterium]